MDLDDLFGTAPPPVKNVALECPPPGIYEDVPAHIYHQWPAVSSTLLKGYAELPSTAREPYQAEEDARVGTGIHAYTLQGESGLAAECLILPLEAEGRSARAIALQKSLAAANPDKTLLPHRYGPGAAETKPAIMDVLRGVDESFRSHPKTGAILRNSKKEISLVWVDTETGVVCKARLDIHDGKMPWDVKKCRSLDAFQWQIKDLFYEVQAGHYSNGAIACGLPAPAFGFLPCEAFYPYRVGCGYLDPDKLAAAQDEARRLIRLVKESTVTGNWPNYRIPGHIYSLGDIQPDDLITVW